MKKERLQELAGIQLTEAFKPKARKKAEEAFIDLAKDIMDNPDDYDLTKEDLEDLHGYPDLVMEVAKALMARGGV